MPRSTRDQEFSAFVAERRIDLLRSACLLTAGDTHLAEDLVQTALARLYAAWPRARRSGTASLRPRSQRLGRTRGGDTLPPLIPWL